ncbi:hypothetical protein H3Z83_11875 [Tenacibaculum sp. S7007]|uniref:Uncharacterized protein n=1 Tax=Tenacibaculum pelagium TaxID=2759527 RepID=A0A839AQ58_9FLAO|nr:hypothetical protein [Tenacibaculum pelagium]MBA6157212.1 hypothetical protein [Tenacibaculum pelagium]
MNAKVVYQVAEALPKEEQRLLFEMLQKKFSINKFYVEKDKRVILTKEEAIQYLLKNIFNKRN